MRILFLSQGFQVDDHPGYHDALNKLLTEGILEKYCNIPFYGHAKKYGWGDFYNSILSEVKESGYDVVFFQYFHGKTIENPAACIQELRKMKNAPIIVTSVGDGFSDNWMRVDYPSSFKIVSRMADITFSTQMGKAASKINNWGARNVILCPLALCQVRFDSSSIDFNTHKFDFDVVFVGSNNGRRYFNPISKHWWGSVNREKLVNALYKRFGNRFGLFGNGWQIKASQGPIPFTLQQQYFQKGRIVVDGNPYSFSDYYASNRPFFEIASGIPTVGVKVPRLDKIFRPDEHYYFAEDTEKVVQKCEWLLEQDPEGIYKKAGNAADYILNKHTQYHRVKFMIETIEHYIRHRHINDIDLPFFLPEVDLVNERKYALRYL